MAIHKREAGLLIPDQCRPWIEVQRPPSDYQAEIKQDFYMIEPYLPEEVNSILDIGCGMAGIDVYLRRKYPNARLTLLDGDSHTPSPERRYGFKHDCSPYNSRAATEAMLEANGVSFDGWIDQGTKETLKADLIISLLSWGFHYPLDTYKVSGFCIADIRRSQQRPRGTIISRAKKYDRCAFTC